MTIYNITCMFMFTIILSVTFMCYLFVTLFLFEKKTVKIEMINRILFIIDLFTDSYNVQVREQ